MIIEIGKIKYNFDLPESFPLSANDIDRLNRVVSRCLLTIRDSTDLRLIVIETWLLVDYYVRHTLEQFYDFSSLECETLDPKYDLLPHSFEACVKTLEKIINEHKKLPVKRNHDHYYEITAPPRIWYDMQKDSPDLFNAIREFTDKYKIRNDNGSSLTITQDYSFNQRYQHPLVKKYDFINKDYLSNLRKINNARNKAAHVYEVNEIYQKLGITGNNAFQQSKSFCLDLIYKTCFVSICDNQTLIAEFSFPE